MSRSWTLVLCVCALALGWVLSTAASTSRGGLDAGVAAFVEKIRAAEVQVRESPSFGSDAEQAGGYVHLARAIIRALEEGVLQDPDYPYFRILDFWLREGGDNPDQRYAFSPLRGGEAYRIWGDLGSARRIEFQLYAGEPWAGTGRSVGYLAFEDMAVDDDGTFVVNLSKQRNAGDANWLENPAAATTVFVRHIYDDWNEEVPGHVHIDRVGYEGRRRPPDTRDALAARFFAAAEMLEKSATRWPDFVAQRYVGPGPANRMLPLVDTYALGGAKGRWMSGGHFDLPPGQALLIETWPTSAQYQGVQLTDMWFASLEHANQVSSLTTRQSRASANGAYHYVVSREDPGSANWLDTGGLARGVFLLRYDGVRGEIPEAQRPSAELVELASLAERIPGFTRVSESEREGVRSARRRHLQLRSGR
ncbi:MAG: hypothetical protein JRH16_01965 [Deltaproteobacteria bacterium]|nr:hypothetical protein [Deltaproteobacteria bacterium]MBW2359308.1 hypothetical protein [Deltaproteobacteria bacterium]